LYIQHRWSGTSGNCDLSGGAGHQSPDEEQKTDREDSRAIRARQRAIGRELRRLYDIVAKEPVPDDFLELLRKIDESGEVKAAK